MKSSASLLSPPPSPHPAPLPLPSSPLTRCSELDLSITLSPAPKLCHSGTKPRPLKKSLPGDQLQPKTGSRGQAGRKVCYEEPLVATVTLRPSKTENQGTLSQQPVRGQRRSTGTRSATGLWVEPPATASDQDPSCLERAELNTTLALKAELQSLEGEEFNSQKAIQLRLRHSERTKNLINTKATEVVNVSRSQVLFSSLVSVDLQEDQLINQVLLDRPLLAPPPRHDRRTHDGPSLFLFMTSDLLRQKPLPPEEEQINLTLHTQRRLPCLTFDLYRKWMQCEATP